MILIGLNCALHLDEVLAMEWHSIDMAAAIRNFGHEQPDCELDFGRYSFHHPRGSRWS